jgi:integrase
MHVRPKGINSIRKRLADGTTVKYWYAWKGGPRLRGEPGSPEFIASYNDAVARKVVPPPGTILSILEAYQASDDFRELRDRTREDYSKFIARIEHDFGAFPLAALPERRTRGLFLDWRDKLPGRSRRQADYALTVFARVLSWALDRGLVTHNPLEKPGRKYRGSRRDKIWSVKDEEAFRAGAPPHMQLPFLLALWTAQREGDLLRLPWTSYNGETIRLRQSRTGAWVSIPVSETLRAALAATPKRGALILTNLHGQPWTADGFRASWRKACARAGIKGLTFDDLRRTAVTRLALCQCTDSEIAEIAGLSLAKVRDILARYYASGDPGLAETALLKRE